MAKVVSVQPKDVYVLLEIPLAKIKALNAVLDKTTVSPENDLQEQGASYLIDDLHPLLKQLVEEYSDAS